MATSITFTDGVGAATLINNKPFPGDRFQNWTPITRPKGDSAATLATGAISMFVFRTDYGVTFDLPAIPSLKGPPNYVSVADRLIAWLLQGGTCAVNTGDKDASAYATCGLWPGTTPTLRLTDAPMLEYTLSLQLLNLAGSPVQMICEYADQ